MKTNALVGLFASFSLAVASIATTGCSPSSCGAEPTTITYTPAQDDTAVAEMQTAWTGKLDDGRSFTLSICEDVGNVSVPLVGCDPAKHLIRGEDQGKSESYTHSPNCALGGCTYGTAMNALGVMTIDGVPTELHGFVQAGVDAYDATTWQTILQSDDGALVTVHFSDGALEATNLPEASDGADAGSAAAASDGGTTSSSGTSLEKSGSAICPLTK